MPRTPATRHVFQPVLLVRPGSSGGIFVVNQSVPAELGGQPLPEMPMEDLAVVMEARRLIEPQVARMAAAFGTPADFQAISIGDDNPLAATAGS